MATICYEKFKENAKELVKKSLNQETQYSLSERNNQVYLSVKQTIFGESYKASGLAEETNKELLCDEDEQLEEEAGDTNSVREMIRGEYYTAEYQVLYCETYQVPLLLVRFFKTSGGLLTPDQVFEILGVSLDLGVNDVSISPHPLDDSPWIKVHPCKTASIMAEIMSKGPASANYLVAFLSYYGQPLGLNLDPKLAISE